MNCHPYGTERSLSQLFIDRVVPINSTLHNKINRNPKEKGKKRKREKKRRKKGKGKNASTTIFLHKGRVIIPRHDP